MTDTPLCERIGIDEADRVRRLAFLDITDEDRRRLSELAPFVETVADEIIDAFYARILAVPETAALLQDPELVERLKRAQREAFTTLFAGSHDAAYFESRLRVGMAHARVDLQPKWYLGGYRILLGLLLERTAERFAGDVERARGYAESLLKVGMLDVQLWTDAYIFGGFVERSLAEAHARAAERATEALKSKEQEEAKREQILGMIVHDVRSPVTAMMATARAGLRRYPDPTEAPGKQFTLIEESGRNVLDIIDGVITVARLSRGEMPVSLEAFDVAEVVASCVEELRPYAQQSGHGVMLDSVEALPVEALDKSLVRRIVSNLLVNAFRHTPPGTHVAVECSERDGACLIKVIDDGPGIPKRVASRAFADTGEAQPRSQGAYADSGLGLPFCRLACTTLGGSIRLEDASGGGTCIVVELPAG